MFHIKICGVRLQNDIEAAGQSPADAIGLNFYAPSIRYVNPDGSDRRAELSEQRGRTRIDSGRRFRRMSRPIRLSKYSRSESGSILFNCMVANPLSDADRFGSSKAAE